MSKRSKRAIRSNPREERNSPDYENSKYNKKKQARAQEKSNVVSFNFGSPKKKDVQIIPRSMNQEDLLVALEDERKHIVFATGPAGSGKTMIATLYAIKSLKEGKIDKIVISRPNVAVDDKDIGFLPGDIISKMAPWTRPIFAEMEEYFSKAEIEHMIKEDIIEVVPVAYLRGRTFKNSVILIDEAQNTTPTSLLSALTRIGENSKMVITGDIKQSDRSHVKNGLADFIQRYNCTDTTGIEVIHFNNSDIQRHPVIKEVLNMYPDIDV